jgi:protocatechuate 3,4-dioxygenase beta subunit
MQSNAGRAWWQAALLALCLLVVPAIAWILVPSAEPVVRTAGSAPRTTLGAPDGETDEAPTDVDEPAQPTPRPAPSPTPDDDGPEGRAVSGSVVDGNGRPVESAWVGCAKQQRLFATTDAGGRFELSGEADGCEAYATHPKLGKSASRVLRAGDDNRLELPLPGSIEGFVVDEGGRPVPSFLLAVESFEPVDPDAERFGGGSRSIEDAQGAFRIEGLAAGKYVLVASADGRPPARSDRIEVEVGRATRGVRMTLPRGGSVVGTVLDRETKQPIEGVRVRLDGVTTTAANAIAAVMTDAQGSYVLEGVPAGPFSVRFTHPEYRERIVPLVAQGTGPLRTTTDLAPRGDGPSSELSGIGATLAQGAGFVTVAGVLRDGPAAAAGMQSGDRIERIDGRSAEGYTVAQCVQLLRGPEGSTVNVTLGRGDSTVELTITRAMVTR